MQEHQCDQIVNVLSILRMLKLFGEFLMTNLAFGLRFGDLVTQLVILSMMSEF